MNAADTPFGARLVRVLVLILAAAAAFAWPGETIAQPESPVSVRAVPRKAAFIPGEQIVIAVVLDHGAGFHTWPAKHVALPENIDEFAIRTEIGLSDKPAWVARVEGIQWPVAKNDAVADPTGENPTVQVPLYSHSAAAFVRLQLASDAAPGEYSLSFTVAYQACNDVMCTPPEELNVPVSITVATQAGAAVEPDLFKAYDPAKVVSSEPDTARPPVSPTLPVAPATSDPKPPATTPPNGADASATGASLFGLNLGNNVFILGLAAALGGFVLNLTPCVLPVIPIKVLTLNKLAGSRRRALILGLWMASGVVAFWTAIGVPMAFISKGFDPSQFIFGYWYITLAIGIVIAVLSLGLMGLFTFNLPQSVYAVETKAESPLGSFMFGVLTAILGLPCFGFVAGGLLAAATALPAATIMVIFVGMGVGMAAPYLVLSVYPDLLKFLPKTGPASNLVKQVMGLLLIAAAAFFITAGIQALLKERPYLAGSMTWWAVGFFVAIAAIWMVIRTWQIAKSAWPKVVMPVLAVVMTLGIGVFAQGRLDHDRTTYFARQKAMAGINGAGGVLRDVPAGVWLEYTPELLAAVRSAGQPVFLDFTASWCITCKALKAAVLDPMQDDFKARGVVLMEVDCTVRSSPGSEKLRQLGRTGVPTWVVYGPGSDKPHFVPVEKPSAGTVLSVLDAAGIPGGSGSPVTPPVAKSGAGGR